MNDKSKRSDATRRGGPPARRGDRRKERGVDQRPDRVWLYGNHAVMAALANPQRRKHRLLVTADAARQLGEIQAAEPDVVAEVLDRRDIDRQLPPGAVHQGMALLAEPLDQVALEDVCGDGSEPGVLVVLDQPNDPRNIGAVLRSAAAFGARGVVVPDRHAPEATAALAKAASGALDRVPLVRVTNLARALAQLKEAGFWCAGLDGDADKSIGEVDWAPRTALVLGAEGAGLRRLTAETCDFLVRIPIDAAADSLNLSAAAAIALYEVKRSRG